MIRRHLMKTAAAAVLVMGLAPAAMAQEVTLKLHQFLPPVATVPAKILKPWAASVEAAAGGKVNLEAGQDLKLVTDYSFKGDKACFAVTKGCRGVTCPSASARQV